jgi:hypothetical protein
MANHGIYEQQSFVSKDLTVVVASLGIVRANLIETRALLASTIEQNLSFLQASLMSGAVAA